MTSNLELLKAVGAIFFLIISGIMVLIVAIKFIPIQDFVKSKNKTLLFLIGFLLLWIGLIWAAIKMMIS